MNYVGRGVAFSDDIVDIKLGQNGSQPMTLDRIGLLGSMSGAGDSRPVARACRKPGPPQCSESARVGNDGRPGVFSPLSPRRVSGSVDLRRTPTREALEPPRPELVISRHAARGAAHVSISRQQLRMFVPRRAEPARK